tara:strand:+ start:49 stop:1002 length:954 start_codon:yes stop_codon:yes gene_type:complete
MKHKIIYIAGGGHSGSTLLSLIIGSSDNVFSLGEVYYFNSFNKPENDPDLFSIYENRCTCGKIFTECKFWNKVNNKLSKPIIIKRKTAIIEFTKIIWNMITPFKKIFQFKLGNGDDNFFFNAVESVLAEIKNKGDYLLDSSKDPRRLVRLKELIGPENIFVIHLVRDGRGFVASYCSKKRPRATVLGLKVRNFFIEGIKWMAINIITHRYLKKSQFQSIQISYDLFCKNPKQYVNVLNEILNLNIAGHYIDKINNSVFHNIHGNWMRQKKLKSIKYDNSWKRDLSILKRIFLSALLYPVNKRFVYRDSISQLQEEME